MNESLDGKTILVTGAARRVRKIFALACARAGVDVAIHHGHAEEEAEKVRDEIMGLGRRAWVFKAELNDPSQAQSLIPRINGSAPLHGLVNSAAIFESLALEDTSMEDWEEHLAINLTAPFLLSQAFARQAPDGGRIVNILDWRALRPAADHFPYTVSKAALASMTRSLAVALAPKIIVNGLALGAIVPLADLPGLYHRRNHAPGWQQASGIKSKANSSRTNFLQLSHYLTAWLRADRIRTS